MKNRILITGITGFIGGYLTRRLLDEGHEVFGSTFASNEPLPQKNKFLHLIHCDIRNKSQVRKLVTKSRPDIIFHLAAQSYPTPSWINPVNTIDTNVNGTLNLFSSILEKKLDPRILVACSSAEYGFTAFKMKRPLEETDPLLPVHPYGLSKVGQDLISYQYFKNYDMKIFRARIFNTIGPGKKDDFVGDVSLQISKIKKGQQNAVVKVGNLHPKRDVTDVRDQVSALIALVNHGKSGEAYNVCSGTSVSMKHILKIMLATAHTKIKIQIDQHKVRSLDEPVIVGNPTKIKSQCKWIQNYSLKDTVKDSIEYWN